MTQGLLAVHKEMASSNANATAEHTARLPTQMRLPFVDKEYNSS